MERFIFLKIIIFVKIIFVTAILPDDEVVNFIKSYGYYGEAYQVITDDNYILKVHHLRPRFCNGRFPVFLEHSAFSTPIYWMNSGSNISLAFFLADNGYDVWFGNVRGSKFATAHRYLSTKSNEYWKFDFHEMGVFDLPASIDLTLQLTGAQKVFYIGHSQACPSLLALLSLRPEYNAKIAQSHLFAPVANMMFIRPSLKPLLPVFLTFTRVFKDFSHVDLTPFLGFGNSLSSFLCTEGIRLSICQLLQFFLLGGLPFDSVTDPEVYRVIIKSLSPEIAVQQVTHYAQNIAAGKFQLFDYGIQKNLIQYGMKTPPEYPLQNLVPPVYLWASDKDFLNTFKDAMSIVPRLSNVYWRPITNWNHIDFVYARDAREKLYKPVISEFEKIHY